MTIRHKNSNQRLIKETDQTNYFLTFAVHFAIECELIPKKKYLFVGM